MNPDGNPVLKLLWTFADGEYSPVVAEKSRLFLIGAYLVYGMVPR